MAWAQAQHEAGVLVKVLVKTTMALGSDAATARVSAVSWAAATLEATWALVSAGRRAAERRHIGKRPLP